MHAGPNVRVGFAARWFQTWLWLFGIAVAGSLATLALGVIPQMKVIGAATLALAVLGMLVCLLGLRLYHPRGWHLVRRQLSSVRESARTATQALAEPRVGTMSRS